MPPSSARRRDTLLVSLAFLAFTGLGLYAGLLGLATPSISAQFNVSLESFSLLLLVQPLGYIASSFVTGRLNAAMGNGRMFILGGVILALGLAGFALVPSWPLLIGAGLVVNAGSGLLDAGLNNYFAVYHNARQMNWLHACFGIGTTVGARFMAEVLARGLPWQMGYLATAAFVVVLTLLFVVTLSRWRDDTPGAAVALAVQSAPRQASLRQTLALPMIWLSIALFFAYAGMELGVGQWTFTLFTEGRGINVETAAIWVANYWATFTIGRILFGFLPERVSITLVIRLCILASVAGALLLALNVSETLSFAGLAILGFAQAPLFPLLVLKTTERVGARHSANAIGFQVSAAGIGFAIGPALSGFMANQLGLESISLFFVVLAVAMVVLHEVTLWARLRPPSLETSVEVAAATD